MRTVLSVSLPDKMSAELEALAKATGRNKSDIIKESLGNYLWEVKFRDVKKQLSSKVNAAGIVTEDEVFKTVS